MVVAKILELRDSPPKGFNRVPGPKAILYFLHQDAELKARERLPRSTRTIWRILRQHQRIFDARRRPHHPVPRPAPMTSWQLDFKDVSSVAPQPDGKQLHVVEVLNTIDVGTSALIAAQARADFSAETALAAVATTLQQHGLPEQVSIDRDPRWVGSSHQRDFPAALVRFLLCLGVEVIVCPPKRPDKNGFVERYHRSYGEEYLEVERPSSLEQVETVTARYQQHYNYERPHQGLSCDNLPPLVAFPNIAPRPPVPALVDVDLLPGSVLAPLVVVVAHRTRSGVALRQIAPLTAGSVEIEQGVEDRSHREHPRPALSLPFARLDRNQRLDHPPLRIAQVTRIELMCSFRSHLRLL
jgi:transposase InsO family protein